MTVGPRPLFGKRIWIKSGGPRTVGTGDTQVCPLLSCFGAIWQEAAVALRGSLRVRYIPRAAVLIKGANVSPPRFLPLNGSATVPKNPLKPGAPLYVRLRQAAFAASEFCFGEVHRAAVLIKGANVSPPRFLRLNGSRNDNKLLCGVYRHFARPHNRQINHMLPPVCQQALRRSPQRLNRDKLVPRALNMFKRNEEMVISQARAISQARGYALVCARVESQTRGSEHYHNFWCHPNEPPQNSEVCSTPYDSRSRRSDE